MSKSNKNILRLFLNKLGIGKAHNEKEKAEDLLRSLEQDNLVSNDVLTMMLGVLEVVDINVRDIMIPRSQMVVLDRDDTIDEYIKIISESGHSRFPVIGEDKDEVLGIFLAKDLIKYAISTEKETFNISDNLRQAIFIPEGMKLDKLLAQFRESRSHLAIVVDEFGGVSGLATIEDVLEQIVGDIDDEYDIEETDLIIELSENLYKIKAQYRIDEFNEFFKAHLDDADYDTLGGLVVHHLERLPKRGESIDFEGFSFKVISVDRRRIHFIEVSKVS
jgi:magnesium and cobalt transporter